MCVCVDFTDLKKACPKDPFPMPRIDQLVDAIVGHPRMSFLDAFQGYHQIPLATEDQEKTAFVTPVGNCHYKHYKKNNLLRRTYCGGCETGRYMSPIAARFGPAAEHGSIAAG